MTKRITEHILSLSVDCTTPDAAADQIIEWARRGESRTVCVANVHMVMEAYDSAEYARVVNAADMTTPDGMPLVWVQRAVRGSASRVCGRDLVFQICVRAAQLQLPIGLYGSTLDTLNAMRSALLAIHPGLNVSFAYSPPFRALSVEEDEQLVDEMSSSGVRVLFVGLGCPKQERWIHEHRGRIDAVMLGVGAAFDFIGGVKPTAPQWMQDAGLEWVHRFLSEPQRMWRRYFMHNPRFVILAGRHVAASIWRRACQGRDVSSTARETR